MDKKFLLRVEQSNKCGSVTINEVFNVPLGSCTGSLVSIPNRPFSLARHQLHSLIQSAQTITQKKVKNPDKIELLASCIKLPWPTYTEPRVKKGTLHIEC